MGEAGYHLAQAPCFHLFIGSQPAPVSYLYTAKEDFCCLSQPGNGPPDGSPVGSRSPLGHKPAGQKRRLDEGPPGPGPPFGGNHLFDRL